MHTHRKPRQHGFTLVELIVTIAIIVLLAGLIGGSFGFVRDKQNQSTARIQIALLSKGIDEYRLDMGVYPGGGDATEFGGNATSAAGDNSEVLYQALFYEGWDFVNQNRPSDDWESHMATTIYVAELDPNTSGQKWLNPVTSPTPPENLKIIDPWGNNYRYRVGRLADGSVNPNAMNPDFDLWSAGKDGATNPGPPYDPNADENRDDIR